MVGVISRHFTCEGYTHDIIPKEGFYVDKSGILYVDGNQMFDEDSDARLKLPGEDCRKNPGGYGLPSPDRDLVESFMPAALSLAKLWDSQFQDGKMTEKSDVVARCSSHPNDTNTEDVLLPGQVGSVLVYDNLQGMKWDANLHARDTVGIDDERIESIVEKVCEQQETQVSLLSAQVDSLQKQIDVVKIVKIEEGFEDEKFDSFKNRAKETLKEAYAVIEDMEGLSQLEQAKAIKEAALTENKRQLVLTHERVRERLERLQANNNEAPTTELSYKKIIMAVVLIALIATFGWVALAFIF